MAECPGRHEAISALLDGELAPGEELELRRHLDRCPRCAAWRECLEALSAGVARSLARERAPQDLGRRVGDLAPRSSMGGVLALAAAALVVGALGGPHPGASTASSLVRDHARLAAPGAVLAAPSSDPAEVARALSERLPFRIEVADVPGARLRGGHDCTIRGHRAAYLQYELEGPRGARLAGGASGAPGRSQRISVFVFPGSDSPAGLVTAGSESPCRSLGGASVCAFAARREIVGVVADSPVAARSFRRAARLATP